MLDRFLFTSESVTEGHPDKIADQISDAILDSILAEDSKARVACETLVTTGLACVAGEVTTTANPDIQKLVRSTIDRIGYNDATYGFDSKTCSVINALGKHTARITSTNLAEFVGEGRYVGEFVSLLNSRLADYSELEFQGHNPSYSVLRYLGQKVSMAMEKTDSKWVLEQVVDIEGPEAIKLIKKSVGEILGVKVT